MKGIFLALLVIAVVLFVTAESRRVKSGKKSGAGKGKGGNSRPNKRGCARNCTNCAQNRTCLECDDGFAKITFSRKRSKTICVPCPQQLSNKRKGLDRDTSKCTTVPLCPKNCSTCKDGICSACNSGFKLRKNKKRCVPCGSVKKGKIIDHPQCGSDGCGKGCKNCTEDGSCIECKDNFELNQDKNKCKRKKVQKDCDIRGCLNCTAAGVCYECSRGLTLNKKSTGCVKECSRADPDFKTPVCREGKRKDKKGKNKRKGGKAGKPGRKTPRYRPTKL